MIGQYTVGEIALGSSHLEDHFHRDRVRLGGDEVYPAMISQQNLSRLGEWIAGETSNMFWIDGPYIEADDLRNPLTTMAAKLANLADSSKAPVMAYFCELRRGQKRPIGQTREMQAFISLLYALIRQEIELLLPKFDTSIDLSKYRFEQLDGTSASIHNALELFSDLLELIPSTTYCVVDGLHWLDDRSTEKPLEAFLDVLRHEKVRVLFTTNGRSACLHDKLTVEEMVSETARFGDVDVEVLGFN
jgi:hypothetical protein